MTDILTDRIPPETGPDFAARSLGEALLVSARLSDVDAVRCLLNGREATNANFSQGHAVMAFIQALQAPSDETLRELMMPRRPILTQESVDILSSWMSEGMIAVAPDRYDLFASSIQRRSPM